MLLPQGSLTPATKRAKAGSSSSSSASSASISSFVPTTEQKNKVGHGP
jgi:hypothetical protein